MIALMKFKISLVDENRTWGFVHLSALLPRPFDILALETEAGKK